MLLPLECFLPFIGNSCRTGSIGVADPETLQWRYYVKLDPAFIDKAMWAEASPERQAAVDVERRAQRRQRPARLRHGRDHGRERRARTARCCSPVRVLPNAVPPSGITGAVFYKGRLLLAGQGGGPLPVWSVDLTDGSRQLEIEKTVVGESEGLDIVKALGGKLHWLITPLLGGGRADLRQHERARALQPGQAGQREVR